jgi:hypothetical protein
MGDRRPGPLCGDRVRRWGTLGGTLGQTGRSLILTKCIPEKTGEHPVCPHVQRLRTAMRAKTVVTGGYFYGYGARAEESAS